METLSCLINCLVLKGNGLSPLKAKHKMTTARGLAIMGQSYSVGPQSMKQRVRSMFQRQSQVSTYGPVQHSASNRDSSSRFLRLEFWIFYLLIQFLWGDVFITLCFMFVQCRYKNYIKSKELLFMKEASWVP